MKRSRFGPVCHLTVVALAAAFMSLPVLAAKPPAKPANPAGKLSTLALEKHCDECHAVASQRIGPPFVAVAARHSKEGAAAVEPLAQKIIHGGAGNWGNVPMIPNERVSLDEARALARWILNLRPG
jgi:cytochrome c